MPYPEDGESEDVEDEEYCPYSAWCDLADPEDIRVSFVGDELFVVAVELPDLFPLIVVAIAPA